MINPRSGGYPRSEAGKTVMKQKVEHNGSFCLKKPTVHFYHLCTVALSPVLPTVDTLNLSFLSARLSGGNSKFLGEGNTTTVICVRS